MKPELVLDDDEKKTRFRKFLSKRAAEATDHLQPGPSQPRAKRGRGRGPAQVEAVVSHVGGYSMSSDSSNDMGMVPVEVKTEVNEMTELQFEDYEYQVSQQMPGEGGRDDRRIQQEILWLRLGQDQQTQDSDQIKRELSPQEHGYDTRTMQGSSKLDILAQIAPDELRDYLGQVGPHQAGHMSHGHSSNVGSPSPSTSTIIYHNTTPVIKLKSEPEPEMWAGSPQQQQQQQQQPVTPTTEYYYDQQQQQQQQKQSAVRKSVIVRAGGNMNNL